MAGSRSRAIRGRIFGWDVGLREEGDLPPSVVRRGTASSDGNGVRGARGGRLLVVAERSPRDSEASERERAWIVF
jgi:hypothetical protein